MVTLGAQIVFGPLHYSPPPAGTHRLGDVHGFPLDGPVTSPFGAWEQVRRDAGLGPHRGVDIAAMTNTPIRAPAPGRVLWIYQWDGLPFATTQTSFGYAVVIEHQNGWRTTYAHMAIPPPVAVNEMVERGDIIGVVGSTGKSTGPHLHWAASQIERVGTGETVTVFDPLTLITERTPASLFERVSLITRLSRGAATVYVDRDDATGKAWTVESRT